MRKSDFIKDFSDRELNTTVEILRKIDNIGEPLTREFTVPDAISCITDELKNRASKPDPNITYYRCKKDGGVERIIYDSLSETKMGEEE